MLVTRCYADQRKDDFMEPAMPPTAPPTITPSSAKSGLLINGNFALLFSGSAISSIGDFVFSTTLVLWIAGTSVTRCSPSI
jgi:hypothetical protein